MDLKRLFNNKFVIIIFVLIATVVIVFANSVRINEKKKNGIKNEGYYYINTKGDILNQYPAQFQSDMGTFNEDGFAFAEDIATDIGYGDAIIDKSGNVLINSKNICVGEENIFPILVRESNKIIILDENFNEIGQVKGDCNAEDIKIRTGFSEGIAGLSVLIDGEELCGYINTNGEWIIEPQYKCGGIFNKEKIAPVQDSESKLWGLINDKGEWVVGPKYSDCRRFTEDGVAKVENPETGLYGYIGSKGELLNDDWYYSSSDFCGGYALVQKEKDGKAAYINIKGEYITDFIFDPSCSQNGFSEGLAYVKEYGGDKYGYINGQGEYVLEPQYFDASKFSCGLAGVNILTNGKERVAYIDKSGKIVIDDNGMSYYPFSKDGYAIVADHKTHKYGMINTKGEWLFKPQFAIENSKLSSENSGVVNGCCVVYLEYGQIIKKPKK